MPECYIRGNTVKYVRVPNEVCAFTRPKGLVLIQSFFSVDFGLGSGRRHK